jgi:predicted site-specific integrase-resolvase
MQQDIIQRLERIEAAVIKPPREYLSIKEAADFIGVSRQTLDLWRMNAQGPAVHRVGKRVLYSIVDLHSFMADQRKEALL